MNLGIDTGGTFTDLPAGWRGPGRQTRIADLGPRHITGLEAGPETTVAASNGTEKREMKNGYIQKRPR